MNGNTVWKRTPDWSNLDLEIMHDRSKQSRGGLVPLYALGAIFFVPLVIGVLMVNNNVSQGEHANQVSRDVASMYAQGLDFSAPQNQDIALKVAEGFGIDMRAGEGVLILSKIRVVHSSDCSPAVAGHCVNEGRPVVTQRYVIGNRSLRPSSFGTPAHIDLSGGNVEDWANDVSARAADFSSNLRVGEFVYAAEFYFASRESRAGVYSRAMF